jgi:hypothetical protein
MTHDADDVLDEREVEQRKLVLWRESNGWTGIEGYVPPDIAGPLWAAMDRWAKPHPANASGADEVLLHDRRSTRQRQADALGLALRLALGADTGNDLDRPHVVIHVRETSPVTDEGLSQAWVARFLCDATVKELRKNPKTNRLELGRNVRVATPTPTPSVDRPGPHLRHPELHDPGPLVRRPPHQMVVKGWPNNLANLAMLCGPHHTAVHAGTWHLEMRNETPWARPPKWLNPEQRWQRNTYQDHLQTVEQLALNIHLLPGKETRCRRRLTQGAALVAAERCPARSAGPPCDSPDGAGWGRAGNGGGRLEGLIGGLHRSEESAKGWALTDRSPRDSRDLAADLPQGRRRDQSGTADRDVLPG